MTEAFPSALAPEASHAAAVLGLFWPVTILLAAIWLLVMAMLLAALVRRGTATPATQRRAGWVVGAATLATALVVTGLTVASALAMRPISPNPEAPVVIQVRGLQWWWEVTYPAEGFVTANEIHVPVGRPVRIELTAADVIHSLWIPGVAGKQDLIPGRENVLVFTATAPGVHRGQCAEFCGLQHAHMALYVVADPPEAFERWRAAQAAPAVADALALEGRAVLEARQCAACHAVRGTRAEGSSAPDLTHLASRRAIAAGLLPVTPGALAAWIADPQTLKPGNHMPLVPLSADELQALTRFLTALR